MTIFAISTRMNAGKPASAGAFSTAFSWSAVYGFDRAQIKTFEPSKSAAEASPGPRSAINKITIENSFMFLISRSTIESYSLDRVTASLHARSVGAIIRIHEILLLTDRLLILRFAILARPASADCGAHDRTDSGASPASPAIAPTAAPPRAPRAAPFTFAATDCGPGLLWWRCRCHNCRIDAGRLLCPGITCGIVFRLLLALCPFAG